MVESVFRQWRLLDANRSDRSAGDRARHRQKVRKAIRENIAEIVAEESLIGRSKGHIVKVPIRGIKEYRFIYGRNTPGAAQGREGTEPGDVIERFAASEGSEKAGDRAGVDYYETEITLEELVEIMFEDLELPNQERKNLHQIEVEGKRRFSGYRRKDIRVRLSPQRTAIERVRRLQGARLSMQQMETQGVKLEPEGRFPFRAEDMRFHYRRETPRKESNAVVICIMDSSGSMDTVKKYLARSFFFLLYRFVLTKYANVEVVFIAHDTEAKEVTEEEFFHKGESGGTMISSGYNRALEVIQERYHPSLWNIYSFHCSDGENFTSDNEAAIELARKLCQICKFFGYGEIRTTAVLNEESILALFSEEIKENNYHAILIEKKEDIWPGFKELIGHERKQQ